MFNCSSILGNLYGDMENFFDVLFVRIRLRNSTFYFAVLMSKPRNFQNFENNR
jgi:hypothetical protein